MGFSSAQQLRECTPSFGAPRRREKTDTSDVGNPRICVLIDIFTAPISEKENHPDARNRIEKAVFHT